MFIEFYNHRQAQTFLFFGKLNIASFKSYFDLQWVQIWRLKK